MIAYISISYNKRKSLQQELDAISEVLNKLSVTPFIFIDHYSFSASQEKEMMKQAFKEIDDCTLLIAETSDKAIGIGIEVGYAKAKNKPVIYLRNKNAKHSTTVAGSSDFIIIYSDSDDLGKQLNEVLKKIFAPVI